MGRGNRVVVVWMADASIRLWGGGMIHLNMEDYERFAKWDPKKHGTVGFLEGLRRMRGMQPRETLLSCFHDATDYVFIGSHIEQPPPMYTLLPKASVEDVQWFSQARELVGSEPRGILDTIRAVVQLSGSDAMMGELLALFG